MTGRVLVLNASFEPMNVCTERRAVVMIFKGIARMEEHNGHMLHSARITMHAPSVIRLIEYIHIPYKSRSLSRKNILLRDHSTCQYCGRQFSPSELTLDHVFPRSRGGESTWDNLVACCKKLQPPQGQPHARRGADAPRRAGRAASRCTSIARSCATSAAPTRPGASTFSTSRTATRGRPRRRARTSGRAGWP